MLYEYAVEPQAIGADWKTFRYLIEKFGLDRGRLISRFPRSWERAVYEAVSAGDFSDVKRTQVIEKLKQAKASAFMRSSRAYDPKLGDWLKNAEHEHSTTPFHAIIAKENASHCDFIIAADDADEGHPLWAAQHGCQIQQVGSALASAMAPLFQSARRVLFVDPYFNIERAGFRESLKCCLEVLAANNERGVPCEIHFGDLSNMPPMDMVKQRAGRALGGIIPTGMSVALHAWKTKPGGDIFHARYLLTDVGGISVEAGFEMRGAHATVQLMLLGYPLHKAKLAAFDRYSTVYELAQPVLEVFADGTVRERRS